MESTDTRVLCMVVASTKGWGGRCFVYRRLFELSMGDDIFEYVVQFLPNCLLFLDISKCTHT